jgi:hypothetical protein
VNLARYPTIEQLRGLIAFCNDEEGNHVLWVDHDGKVSVSLVPEELPASELDNPELIRFRFEVWLQGNGDVGLSAARDETWIKDQFENLKWAWQENLSGVVDFPARSQSSTPL